MKKEASPEKIDQIIQVAQERFGMFGMEKTTMQDIASDLGMTKGSLYYYFQDKEQLYLEVVKNEFNEFISSISKRLENIEDPEEKLLEYVRMRSSLFQALVTLSRFRIEGGTHQKSFMNEFWLESRSREKEVIEGIFSLGFDRGQIEESDLAETAYLFLDLLKGLRLMSVRHKKFLQLDADEYDQLMEKTLRFTRIFFRGLMNQD